MRKTREIVNTILIIYILLHFERIYKAFEKSECREGKLVTHCMLGEVIGLG